MEVFRKLVPYLRPYRWQLLAGLIALLIAAPAGLAHPLFWRYIVNEVVVGGRVDRLIPTVMWMLLVQLIAVAFGGLHQNLLEKVGQRFVVDLRRDVHAKLQEQSLQYHHDHRVGDLLSRAMSDIDAVQEAVLRGIDSVLSSGLNFVLVVGVLIGLNATLGLSVLFPMVLVWILVRYFNAHIKSIYRAVRDRLGDVSAKLQENLAGVVVVKAFAREKHEARAFQDVNRRYLETAFRAINARTLFFPAVRFVGFIGSAIMIGLGGWLVLQGRFDIGGLVAYRGYWWQLYSPIDTLATVNELLQRAVASGSRVFEVLEAPVRVSDPPDARTLDEVKGRIEFDDVSFAYRDEVVLSDLTLEVEEGETLAIVGPSGAGKSTLLGLVPRFYDPQSGAIRVDGVDVREVEQRSLRRYIGIVLQDTFLFNGTIMENIRYGNPEAAEEDVRRAAALANAHDFIEALPEGYETRVGERGVKLSGGQRQRISIARAFLADPRILILDEATSAVEPESEWIIQQTLEKLMRGRTTLITSHRLSMVRKADRIAVLDKGRLVALGPHAELMKAGGLYREMYDMQMGQGEDNGPGEFSLPG